MTKLHNYPGRIELGDDEPLDVDLTVTSDELRIASTLVDIGAWPLHHCLIVPLGEGRYSIEVDGDVIEYSPTDDDVFSAFLDAVVAGEDLDSLTPVSTATMPVDDLLEPDVDDGDDDDGGIYEIDPGIGDVGLDESEQSVWVAPGDPDDPEVSDVSADRADELEVEDELTTPFAPSTGEGDGVDEVGGSGSFDEFDESEADPEDEHGFADSTSDAEGFAFADEGAGWLASGAGVAGTGSLISRINEMKARNRVDGDLDDYAGAEPEPQPTSGGFLSRLRSESEPDLESISNDVSEEQPNGDTEALAAAVESLKLQPSDYEVDEGGTVADAILASQRTLRSSSSKSSDLPDRLKKVALVAGVVILLAGLALGAFVVIRFLVSSDPNSSGNPAVSTLATTAATTSPTTTAPAPTTTATPLIPVGFALPAPEFVQRWNETAEPINPQLRLSALLPGDFDILLTQYISVAGTVAENGGVSAIELRIDPTGPVDQDVVGIQALGLMIAAVDPNLTGAERKALLSSMGLNVDNPVLVGVDGVAASNGVQYSLIYESEAVLLRFRATG